MSAPPVVLDTSVIVKWLRQGEVRASQALAWRRRFLDGEISVAVPGLLAYELANVLLYKNEMAAEQVKEAISSIFDMGFDWIDLSPPVLLRSIELAREHDITVYDAVFVALAEILGAEIITADESLARRLQALEYVRLL